MQGKRTLANADFGRDAGWKLAAILVMHAAAGLAWLVTR